MNKYWMESYFPDRWREAIVFAFLKPEKDHSNPENDRHIALTNCICKVMERRRFTISFLIILICMDSFWQFNVVVIGRDQQ